MRLAASLTATSSLSYAIGDVHGRLDLLQRLLDRCRADAARRGCEAPLFVFLGDYVDHGPESAGVIRLLRDFSFDHSVIALKGNHEAMLIDTILNGGDGVCWAANGMASTTRSFGYHQLIEQQMPAAEKRARLVSALRSDPQAVDDACWLSGLPLHHEDQHRIYVHAGIRPGVPLAHQSAHDLLWIREEFLRYPGAHSKVIVHGHTPTLNGRPEVRFRWRSVLVRDLDGSRF